MMHIKAIKIIKRWHAFLHQVNTQFNTEFKINIWIDKIGSGENVKKLESKLAGIATLKDITEEGISNPIIRYQIDRLRPNYGAASDNARYRIIKTYKGLYLDTDVVNPPSPEKFFNTWKIRSVVLPDQFAEQLGMQCSDVILNNALDEHPFINFMVEMGEKNYRVKEMDIALTKQSRHRYKLEASPVAATWQLTYLAETDEHQKEHTLRAGANLLISDWLESQYSITGGPANSIDDMRRRAGYSVVKESDLRVPLEVTGSDLSWRGSPVSACSSLESAVDKALNSILFQIEYQGVLRLDDHILNVIESVSELNIPEYKVVSAVLDRVGKLLKQNDSNILKQINMAQLTFRFEEVEYFYHSFDLIKKTCLFNNNKDNANYNTKAILKNATQPFLEIHLPGKIARLKSNKQNEETEIMEINYCNKHLKARIEFLKGFIKFYYKLTYEVDTQKPLDGRSQLILEKITENIKTVVIELEKISNENPTASQSNVQNLLQNAQELLKWADDVKSYREYKESRFSIISLFKSAPRPKLSEFTDTQEAYPANEGRRPN